MRGPTLLKAYLAGPEVFHPDAAALGVRKKALCEQEGFIGLFPLDNETGCDGRRIGAAMSIYQKNKAMIDQADVVIANVTPFRGLAADPGTVFEIGYAAGRGLPVFGYTLDPRSMLARVGGTFDRSKAIWLDPEGWAVEDFGFGENLMVACALLENREGMISSSASIGPDAPEAFDLFARCLKAARRRADWLVES